MQHRTDEEHVVTVLWRGRQVDGIFVMNGFYMSMRSAYTTPPAQIHYFTVQWPTGASPGGHLSCLRRGREREGRLARAALRRSE